MNNEEFLKDICPNHTDKSKWNKSELLTILDKYQALQLQQVGVMVSSLRSNFAKSREQSVKVAEINAIRHCLELYANFEVDEEVIQKAVERYRCRN